MADVQPGMPNDRARMGCAWTVIGTALIVWGGLTWVGYSAWVSTAARVPHSPYLLDQWRFYVGVPLAAAATTAVLAAALVRWKRLVVPVTLVGIVLLFLALGYLLPYSGGV